MADSNVLKILYVLDMLNRTDEFHPINSTQIIDNLKKEGLKAERKSIGNYIRILSDEMGYDIIRCDNKNLGWYMVGQTFEDYELKIMVDAINSAKFITAKDTREIRKKILGLATQEGNRVIKAGMVMDETLKMTDPQFMIKFDTVMRAIADHKQIQFQYQDYGKGNQKLLKKNGKVYQITPYYLGVWNYEYFVVANTKGHDNVSFYRVEMMKNVETTEEPSVPMTKVKELKDIGKNGRSFGDFIKETVHLRGGTVKSIRISGINHLRRAVMKKFGNKLSFRDEGEDRFSVRVNAVVSEGFYQWIAQFGSNMKIEGPKECVTQYKEYLKDTLKLYEQMLLG